VSLARQARNSGRASSPDALLPFWGVPPAPSPLAPIICGCSVFVSINVYGNASEFLAGLLTLFFVAGLALLFALQGWLSQRFFNCSFYIFSFAALWVLGEWTRSWFLTGFPWLYLGYPHTQSSFAGIAPLFGVFGISLIVALSGAGFGEMVLIWNRHTERKAFNVARSLIPTALFFLWIFANLSGKISWVDPVEDAVIKVGLVQANIEQGQAGLAPHLTIFLPKPVAMRRL